jgi:uncharacterized protein
VTIVYFDTSALAKLYFSEPGSDLARTTWREASEVVASELAYAEMLATFSRKHREATSDEARLAVASKLDDFLIDWASILHAPLDSKLRPLLDELHVRLALRGADSAHLATAWRLSQSGIGTVHLACADLQLIDAAEKIGLNVIRTL